MKAQNNNNEAAQLATALKVQVKNEVEKAQKKSLAEIMNIGRQSASVGGRKTNSIYVAGLYEEYALVEDRKKLRRQIRRKLERDFLSIFLVVQNDQKRLAQLANDWKEYAPNIYRDIFNIYDGSDVAQKNLCQRFCEAMAKVINK